MMDVRSGHPYFAAAGGIPYTYPQLHDSVSVDVLVIGGGISGALCAYHCSKAGLQVMLMEASSIGGGSSSASTALLQYEIDTPLWELAKKIGEENAVVAYRSCMTAVDGILDIAEALRVSSKRRKSIQYASKKSHVKDLEKEVKIRTKHNIPARLVVDEELREILPFSPPAAIMTDCAGEVDPYLLTHALVQESLLAGAQIVDRTPMEEHAVRGGTHLVRTENGHIITAKHVIDCRGYTAADEVEEKGIALHSTYAIASERMDRDMMWAEDMLIWETADPYLYLRTTADRRVIIGGLDEKFKNDKVRDLLMPKKSSELEMAFKKMMPALNFKKEFSWCGTFGSTNDGLPYIDMHPQNGKWYLLGMGGNGITFSYIGSLLIRDALLGKPRSEAYLYRFGRS